MMKITNEILRDVIHCPYKVFKKINDHAVQCQTEIGHLYKRLKDNHNQEFNNRFINRVGLSLSFNVTFQNKTDYK
jgi:hypothetical protein